MMRPKLRILAAGAALTGVVGAGGCDAIWGVHAARLYVVDGGTGAGGTAGGGGTGGEGPCVQGSTTSCYSGPAGTEGVGICKAGVRTCDANGSFGPCQGDVTPQIETCANSQDENCDSHDCAENARLLGDSSEQEPFDVATDPMGNVYVVGQFSGALKLDSKTLIEVGDRDAFLIKLDPDLKVIWGQQFGTKFGQVASAVAVDDAGNVIVGGFSDDALDLGGGPVAGGLWIAKLSPDGKHVWSKNLGGAFGSALSGVAAMPSGDVVCVGHFLGAVDFGDGPIDANVGLLADGTDGFVAKLRSDSGSGKASDGGWGKTIGDDAIQSLRSVRVDGSGNILIAGSFQGSINLSGLVLTSAGSRDIYVAKLDATGGVTWQKQFGDGADQFVTGLAVDSSGGALLGGVFEGSVDFDGEMYSAQPRSLFAVKLGTDGVASWSKAFATDGKVVTAFDPSGNALVAGAFSGKIDLGGGVLTANGTDAFLAKLTDAGAIVWSRSFGDSKDQIGRAVGALPSGESVLVGTADGTTDFGTGPLKSAGNWDIFVTKFGM